MTMLEYREVSPLPEYCLNCQEQECYNCDFALYRWELINDNTKDLFRQMNERREARAIERERYYREEASQQERDWYYQQERESIERKRGRL